MSERICEKMRRKTFGEIIFQEKGVDKWIFTLDFEIIFLAGGKWRKDVRNLRKF